MDRTEFWLVWNPDGRNPHYRHDSLESATAEADRLAAAKPSDQFYVLHAVELREAAEVPVNSFQLQPRPPEVDDGIPF